MMEETLKEGGDEEGERRKGRGEEKKEGGRQGEI